MSKSKINVGDTICYKRDCLAGTIEKTGKVTEVRKTNVEVYTETPSSHGWSSIPYKDIISVNGKQY